jgi:hypothetical protein
MPWPFLMLLFTEVRRRGPTASLMRNDLLSTARRARIGERKSRSDAQNHPEGGQKWAKSEVAERDIAK